MLKIFFIMSFASSLSFARSLDFSIDQEFKVRKLSKVFSQKYGMKIKIKREKGSLNVSFWDKGFFHNDWKLTSQGASFVRRLSDNLCDKEEACKVMLKSHHAESSSRKSLVKSQYKLVSVSRQILRSKVLPESLTQMSLGDRDPLVDPKKSNVVEDYNFKDMNTRIEISFIPKGEIR